MRSRSRHAYRRKDGAGRNYLPRQGEVAQPFGAITLPPPPPQNRNPRILKLLWWSLPVVVLLLVAGGGLVGLWAWASSTHHASDEGDRSQARVAYRQQVTVTRHFPQPWLAQYNLGTVLVDEGSVSKGLEFLLLAHEGVPKAIVSPEGTIGAFSYECQVRFNIGAALELQGDMGVRQGDDEDALERYEEAVAWVSPCQISGGQGESGGSTDPSDSPANGDEGSTQEDTDDANEQVSPEMADATGESVDRLNEKIDRLKDGESDPDSSGSESGKPSQDGGTTSPGAGSPSDGSEESEQERERREQLEKKNRDQERRQREKDELRRRQPGVGNW